jgi:Ca2+-binding RTX toxin-like protein
MPILMETMMGKLIKGTNKADELRQNGRVEVRILGLGGNDTIVLDRDDDNGGGNTVDAGTGNDIVANVFEGGNRIALGAGNDQYFGTGFSLLNQLDIVDAGGGNDKIFVSTLFSTYKGGSGNDLFASTGFKNSFDGGAGVDTISYQFRHEDRVIGDEAVTVDLNVQLVQTGSNSFEHLRSIENAIGSLNGDLLIGSNGNNVLDGLAGNDELQGGRGNDRLIGGRGQDALFGDAGGDRFVFLKIQDSLTNAPDRIFDFNRGAGDRIDLSGIDANTRTGGNGRFTFIGSESFSGQAGELRFANGFVLADTNGNGAADMAIQVDNQVSLSASDFIL